MVYKVTSSHAIYYLDARHVTLNINAKPGTATDFTYRLDLLKRLISDVYVTDWELIEDNEVPVGVRLYTPWPAGPAIPPGVVIHGDLVDDPTVDKGSFILGTAANPLKADGTITEIAQRVKDGKWTTLDLHALADYLLNGHPPYRATQPPFLPSLADINRPIFGPASPKQVEALESGLRYVQQAGRGNRIMHTGPKPPGFDDGQVRITRDGAPHPTAEHPNPYLDNPFVLTAGMGMDKPDAVTKAGTRVFIADEHKMTDTEAHDAAAGIARDSMGTKTGRIMHGLNASGSPKHRDRKK